MEPIEGRRLASARDGTDGMTGRKRSWLPWSLGVASLATLTVAVIVGIAEHSSDALPAIPVFVAFALVGTVVAANRPGNPIGWLLLADGLGGGIGLAGESYARYGARAGHPLPPPSGEERQQVKWIAYAGAVAVIGLLLAAGLTSEPVIAFVTLVPLLPIAAAVAIFKYRLYDIDVVINKTVVYGLLAAFITAVYVAIVVGIGALIGQGTSKPNLGRTILP